MSQYSVPEHVARVAAIVDQVKKRPADKTLCVLRCVIKRIHCVDQLSFRHCRTVSKATRSHTPHTKGYKTGAHMVDVRHLTSILSIDASAQCVTVEGQVNMRQLAEATLAHGCAIPVIPELSAFTVAGLINGLGIQSSSHRYGLFPDNLVSFECVLGDGSVVIATADNEHKDLFINLPGSYGSLGVITAATIRLIAAGPYVRSRYWHFDDMTLFSAAVSAATGQPYTPSAKVAGRVPSAQEQAQAVAKLDSTGPVPTFVEGFVYSEHSAVLVCSEYSRHPGGDNNIYYSMSKGEHWYHQHALFLATKGSTRSGASTSGGLPGLGQPFSEDALPSVDYLFRLERGYWWVVDHIVGLQSFTSPTGAGATLGIDHALRLAVDEAVEREVKTLPTGVSSWAGQSRNPAWSPEHMHRCMVHQDMGVRLGRLEETVRYTLDNCGVVPVWVCPFRVITRQGALWNAGWAPIAAEVHAPAAGPEHAADPQDRDAGFPIMAVDVGLYGEPTARGFTSRSAIRALQSYVDVPAFWGMSYLTQAELEAVYDFPAYEATRKAYGYINDPSSGRKAALPDIRAKTSYWDPDKPDLPPMFAWRLHRAGIFEVAVAVAAVGLGAVGLGTVGLSTYLARKSVA